MFKCNCGSSGYGEGGRNIALRRKVRKLFLGFKRDSRLESFWNNIQRDLRLFIFILLLVCLYRALFMLIMHSYINPVTEMHEIFLANWMGMRLSLKTAGGAALVTFVFLTLTNLAIPKLYKLTNKLRLYWGTLVSFVFNVLFVARFPFYNQFHMTYNAQQVMAGANEKTGSVLTMMIQDYGLIWRMAIAILLTIVCCMMLRKLLQVRTLGMPSFLQGRPLLFTPLFVVVFAAFFLFIRFGGSFTFGSGINWESSGVTSDDFLNECVLDDMQAMYRVRAQNERMKSGKAASFVNQENIRDYLHFVAGHNEENGDDITPYLARTAKGPHINKPKHIFIILEESGAAWPLLDKYADLHVADGIKSLINSPNGYGTHAFMPNGEYTSVAFDGIISGLSEMRVAVNYQPRSVKEQYPTALATQLKKLGYKVDFWYGGNPSWASMKQFALTQGFDNFYGYTDMGVPKVNTFGTSDEYLLQALYEHLPEEQPTVHVVKTESDHPPYNIDLEAEGFDLARTEELTAAMPDVENPKQLAKEIGHYWYTDKVVTEFIKKTEAKYPDSLFIVTGDHAVRTDPSRHPTLFEHQAVPLLIYGAGINKDILPTNAPGGLTSIMPTIMELIAPKGFVYYSIVPSMTEADGVNGMQAGFNTSCFLTRNAMGAVDKETMESLPWTPNGTFDADAERAKAMKWLPAARTISWWLAVHGTDLNAK